VLNRRSISVITLMTWRGDLSGRTNKFVRMCASFAQSCPIQKKQLLCPTSYRIFRIFSKNMSTIKYIVINSSGAGAGGAGGCKRTPKRFDLPKTREKSKKFRVHMMCQLQSSNETEWNTSEFDFFTKNLAIIWRFFVTAGNTVGKKGFNAI